MWPYSVCGELSGGAHATGDHPMVFLVRQGRNQGRHEAVGLPEGLAEVEGAGEPSVQDKVLQTRAEEAGVRP